MEVFNTYTSSDPAFRDLHWTILYWPYWVEPSIMIDGPEIGHRRDLTVLPNLKRWPDHIERYDVDDLHTLVQFVEVLVGDGVADDLIPADVTSQILDDLMVVVNQTS